MTDLQKLIEAVEAGLPSPTNWQDFSAVPTTVGPFSAHNSYHGSLDAAKALHEALLPGWQYHLSDGTATVEGSAWQYYQQSTSTARAWLLAILRAYETRR